MSYPLPVIFVRIMQSGMVWLGALIVANIAYISWIWTLGRSEAPIPPAQLSSNRPSLRLLAEVPPEQLKLLVDEQLTLALLPGSDREATAVVCRVWGPFTSRAEVEKVERDVAANGGQARVTESIVPGRPDYLVYIGTPGNAQNAHRVLEELKTQAIDSALIRRGRFNNTVSVGVFSRNDRAQRQRRRVAKLGYDVGIEEIDRSYNVFHLEATVLADFVSAVAPSGTCGEIAQAH